MKPSSKAFAPLLALLLFLLTCQRAPAQPLSASKIAAHLINNYTIGSSNIVAGHPRTLKVLGLDSGFPSGMVQAMRNYKAQVPLGKLVVRIYSPKTYSLANDATVSATDFWTTVLQPGLNAISVSDRALIDYLEGPNEGQTPTLGYPGNAALQASQWFNQFWTNLTPLMVAAGYKPCIGSIAVGNPGGSTTEMQSYLAAFVPALRQAKAAGGAWSYHAYTIDYTTDPAAEFWLSLRYRQFYAYFASAFADLNTMPLLLTEGGVDATGDPNTSGWQARGTPADYQRWLNWFDAQLQQDSYVLGCTLFQNGDPGGWSSFDLEPISGWLKNYLITPSTPPPAPGPVTALANNGIVTLSWTNAPLTPTTWTVRRATNSAGPFFALVTNLTAGVRATTCSDATVANNVTYYYVVTAVNAFGESSNSPIVSAIPSAPFPSAINCGGPAVGPFLADIYYDAGATFTTANIIDTSGVANPAPMSVYQSQRYGNLTYSFPYLPPFTSYQVRLHFAETYWTAANQRRFNVFLNGAPVLSNFDIFSAAGANFKANIQEFNGISDKRGILALQLASVLDNASINGIEVLPNPTNAIPAVPAHLAATVGNALVTLTWSAPSGAAGFYVRRATASGGPYAAIASNITSATYLDTSFAPNITYYYVVSATNALGDSGNSAPVSARPTNGLPDLVVTAVSWTPAANLLAGANVLFKATVLNQGSAAWPNGINLGVGFLVDGVQVSYEGGYVSPLARNASVTLTANGGPSGPNWVATVGNHTITANADDINRAAEGNEGNNALDKSFTVFSAGYALNCGGSAVSPFLADANFVGSANTFSVTNVIDVAGVPGAAPMAVYQSERWGDFSYVLNNLIPGGNYTIRLHFAEIFPSVNNVGDRRFNISVNGVQVFADFDVLAVAGAKFRAVTREIKKRADDSGVLLIQFSPGSANQPACNGLQAFSSAASPAPFITSITVANGGAAIAWQSSPGTIYQLQSKNDLGETNWVNYGPVVVASANTLSATNNSSSAQRYFRVLQIN